ncbi:cytochrome P450 [Actinocorallia sp. A-T 12471]|uniref:cytochrome P450 n=1 Tax=Actinocorallia sp. A-T 12471 TaxID=3089813 RepID=UPI0029CF5994|nr:cytochrome P450 [Actinocorallia sp. A-T 12471]MDX6742745.1 cytochrome P450 [Actinocorallia sp. A-T 12471]
MTLRADPCLVDILDPAFQRDPYPYYARLRAEAPVHRLDRPKLWLLSRHADVAWALREPRLFSSADGVAFSPGGGTGSLVGTDDPDHGRLRRVLSRQFTPRGISVLEDQVGAVVGELVAALVARTETRPEFDFVRRFADPLPTRVIAGYLGLDPDHWETYQRWSNVLNAVMWVDVPDPELITAAERAAAEAVDCFSQAVAERRARPREDLIGRMAAAHEGGALSDDEIINFCGLLMIAGNITTSSALAHSVVLLLRHPDQRRALLEDPSLIPAAVEEILRFESPIQGFCRTATQDIERHGVRISAGDRVMLLFGSANRDPSAFPDPDRFDVRRDPAGHLAFGTGPHVCLGAWLARIELRVALTALLPHLDRWSLDPAHPPTHRMSLPAFRDITELRLQHTP